MSRVGRRPIDIPKGVKVVVSDGKFTAEGPKGRVTQELLDGFPVNVENNVVTVSRAGETGPERAKHGLMRALLVAYGFPPVGGCGQPPDGPYFSTSGRLSPL